MNLSRMHTVSSTLWFTLLTIVSLTADPVAQRAVPATEAMPALPEPLAIRSWPSLAQDYYSIIFDPAREGEGFPACVINDKQGLRMKSYLGGKFDTEAFTCLAAVAGAKLCGLEPQALNGHDFVKPLLNWIDPTTGMFRHRANERGPEIHADIYGYWPAILGLVIADLYPGDSEFQSAAAKSFESFHRIARGLGAPTNPDFSGLGWNFATAGPGGRNEPMNRFGHAPAVAWVLMAGGASTGVRDMLECSRAAMQWHIDHPGRYEITHVMGPLTAARLNTMGVGKLDLEQVINAWFGDGPREKSPWYVTRATRLNGITCDGLDAARKPEGFYAFTMGSLQNPAWLVPVVRYDPSFARAIGRFALHAANSCRLLQGEGLAAENQDHAEWKARWDPNNLFFYEGLRSQGPTPQRSLRPYATGDPISHGWSGKPKVPPKEYFAQKAQWFGKAADNIAPYMGNHVGFLGGIVETSDVPGILSWDCVKTDWYSPPAYPTRLLFNPHDEPKTIHLDLGAQRVHAYDLVSRRFLVRGAKGSTALALPADTPAVMVLIPASARLHNEGSRFLADDIVIDWNSPSDSN